MTKAITMKMNQALLILVTTLVTASSPNAFAKGGKDGGGGNVRGSTDAEIIAAISSVTIIPPKDNSEANEYRFTLYNAFRNMFDGVYYKAIRDADVVPVLKKIYGSSSYPQMETTEIFRDLQRTPVRSQVQGCVATDSPTDTSASTSFSKGAPICISLEKLRTIPKDVLPIQIRALLAHEFAHHFGLGEKEANILQNFMLYKSIGVLDTDVTLWNVGYPTLELGDRVHNLNSKLANPGETVSDLKLCFELGQFWTFTSTISIAVSTGIDANNKNPYQPGNYGALLQEANSLRYRATSLSGYCDVDSSDGRVTFSITPGSQNDSVSRLEHLKKGDRAGVVRDLAVFEKEMRHFGDRLQANSFSRHFN
jgi:hypothetical protein